MDRQLFDYKTLNHLPPWVALNATNLRTGKGWRFMHDRAGDGLAGATENTGAIRIAEAVAASAAYPGLTDSYAFATRWEHMRGDLLSDGSWSRPPAKSPGYVSHWRARYGAPSGPVLFPLVDGGLYDNEGVNTLRSHRVTHVVISSVAPPASDTASGFTPGRLMRLVEVMHDRLGGATRQLAHEMTHGVDPTDTARRLQILAESLRTAAEDRDVPATVRTLLTQGATEAEELAKVGTPPRGRQFTASAQVLLHRTDLAENAFALPARGGHNVPEAYRGLDASLVESLARVRTDLDALEPLVVDLLVAQGYFVADFMVKLTMADIVFAGHASQEWYAQGMEPKWQPAHAAVQMANANRTMVAAQLESAGKRAVLIGRVPTARDRWRYRANLALIGVFVFAVLIPPVGWLLYGLWRLIMSVGD